MEDNNSNPVMPHVQRALERLQHLLADEYGLELDAGDPVVQQWLQWEACRGGGYGHSGGEEEKGNPDETGQGEEVSPEAPWGPDSVRDVAAALWFQSLLRLTDYDATVSERWQRAYYEYLERHGNYVGVEQQAQRHVANFVIPLLQWEAMGRALQATGTDAW